MISALEALEYLRAGNRRFVSGEIRNREDAISQARLSELASGQQPYATILGCSDSRVTPEIVFDQGLGDLFVVRVAGNIATPSQINSIEFATKHLGSRLVVVLGHSKCGAVQATLEALAHPKESRSSLDLSSIVDNIQPSIEALGQTDPPLSPEILLQRAVRANITAAADRLRNRSEFLKQWIQSERLLVVGAEYSLETGAVDFFEGLPTPG